jgi:hypothetical protein
MNTRREEMERAVNGLIRMASKDNPGIAFISMDELVEVFLDTYGHGCCGECAMLFAGIECECAIKQVCGFGPTDYCSRWKEARRVRGSTAREVHPESHRRPPDPAAAQARQHPLRREGVAMGRRCTCLASSAIGSLRSTGIVRRLSRSSISRMRPSAQRPQHSTLATCTA